MKIIWIFTVLMMLPITAFTSEVSPFGIYNGIYELNDGRKLTVTTTVDALSVKINTGSLLDFADIRGDSRVLAIEAKTAELMNSSISKDRKRIAELFVKSNGNMDDYIDGYFSVIEPALALKPKKGEFEIINTTYRDEDSDYGFSDLSWGWETFTRFSKGNQEVIVRIVWDGVSGQNVHRGTGKLPIRKKELIFKPRLPSRSWIKVYSPKTKKTQMVRELPRENRKNIVTSRFIAYDIETHNTVGIRFRKDETMRLEIGPLGSDVFTTASQISAD